MLPKRNRLTSREDFSNIFSKGKYVAISDGISIKYLKTSNDVSKIGFPVGKNYSKKAVDRNRAKRVLRSATYRLIPNLKPGFDIVVMIRPGYKDIKVREISEQLTRVFIKANLLK